MNNRDFNPEKITLGKLMPPILLESVLRSTVGLVNVAFLSHISASAVNAVSIANQYIMLCQIIAMAVATGTVVCINQAIGMKNLERVDMLGTITIALNALLGILFGALFATFSNNFLIIMSVSEHARAMSASYMRIVGGAMVLQCVQMALCNMGRSLGKTKMPLTVNLVLNGVNILGCYLVIFRIIPTSGSPVDGIAVVNIISQAIALLLAAVLLSRTGIHIHLKHLRPFPGKDIKLALSIGVPGGLNNIAYSMSQIATTALISQTGEAMMAAKVFVSQIVGYVALVGQASAHASIIMIGYRIGAGSFEEAMDIRKHVTRIALLSNLGFSLLLMLLRYPLLGIFTKDDAILQIAATIMLLDVFVEIGRALNNTISGALQAVGDVTYQLIINQASGWLIAVGLSYVLGIRLGWGLYGVWIAFALDEAARGLTLLYRWRSRKWQPKTEQRRQIIAGGHAAV